MKNESNRPSSTFPDLPPTQHFQPYNKRITKEQRRQRRQKLQQQHQHHLVPSECLLARPGVLDHPPDSLLHCRISEGLSSLKNIIFSNTFDFQEPSLSSLSSLQILLQFTIGSPFPKKSDPVCDNLLVISKSVVNPGGSGWHISDVESLQEVFVKILEKGNTVLNLWPKMPAKELHMTHQICLHPASQVESHLKNYFASIQTHFNRRTKIITSTMVFGCCC